MVWGAPLAVRGQAAVEAALTLPLVVFMLLGTLQLFLVMQGRILAQYAAFRAVRAGVVNHGDCRVMSDAALGALLPSLSRTDDPARVVAAFAKRSFANQYKYTGGDEDSGHTGQVFWLDRQPILGVGVEQKDFDQSDANGAGGAPTRLEAQLVFWFPMKIPFANWVMSRMFLAYFGIRSYTAQNPLMMTAPARQGWRDVTVAGPAADIRTELNRRVAAFEYDFPVIVSYSMRMMTPVRTPFPVQCPRYP